MKGLVFILFLIGVFSQSIFSQTGPGGVGNSATNRLWLKGDGGAFTDLGVTQANQNQQVRQWNDNSGNGNNATQGTAGNRPLFEANVANGFPGLRFTGNLFIDGPGLGMSSTSSYTYLMVFRDTTSVVGGMNDGAGHFILDRTTATNNLVSLKPINGNFYGYQKRNNGGGGLGGPLTTTSINTNIKIIQMRRDYNVDYRFFYNANQESSLADANGPTASPNPRIGRHATTANNGLRGYINEFIIYNFALNTAQTIIVNNYLAAKYGLTLDANDCYTGDNVGAGNYDHDVAGIGRVDASNIHNDAQGSGMVRILNPTNLGDDEFLIWGHDNGLAQAQEFTDLPAGVAARFVRVWRVSERNAVNSTNVNVGDLDMRWDLSNLGAITSSDLRLLIDTDNDGVFSDETPISGATSLGGNIYEFSGVPGGAAGIRNSRRFTIGTADKTETPLPIKLISFEANVNQNQVDLKWITSTEINNDFFTIERSADAINWDEVLTTTGSGNSNQILEYFEVDFEPLTDVSYYRLKQTDYNGDYSYSNIVPVKYVVNNSGNGTFSLYPSPIAVGKTLNIEFDNILEEELLVVLRDIQGKEFYSKVFINIEGGKLIGVPIESHISSGVYLITATSENQMYSQKLIIK
jgi:hypothetical protein